MENIGIFGQQGWICPKCGRVFSPFTMMCPYCKKEGTTNLPDNVPLSGDVPKFQKGNIAMNTKLDFRTIYQNWEDCRCWIIFPAEGLMSCRLSIYDDTPEDAIISDLFVPENCRKQGLGSEILEYCEKFAKEQGCESISLRSDNDDWVREWYKRLGFEVESSQVWLKKNI